MKRTNFPPFGLGVLITALIVLSQCLFGMTQSPPVIPDSFITLMTIHQYGVDIVVEGQFFYSVNQTASLLVGTEYFIQDYLNVSLLSLADTAYTSVNNQCRVQGEKWSNQYSWVQYSTYGGNYIINGKETQMWYLNVTNAYLAIYTVGNTPVQLFVSTMFEGVVNLTTLTTFYEFVATSIPDSVFEIPAKCQGNGPVCPLGGITDLQLYMFHTPTDYSITNNDAADLLGDANFICLYGTNGAYQLISTYSVQVNSTWGQYALCNFHECVSLNQLTVGREATEGLAANGGQCTPNVEIGSWYSFPEAGACPNNGPVTEGCYWGNVTVLKTITLQCLADLGFWDKYCATEKLPVYEAAIVLNQAFVSDDPALGGCPPYTNTTNEFELLSTPDLAQKFPLSDRNGDPFYIWGKQSQIFSKYSK